MTINGLLIHSERNETPNLSSEEEKQLIDLRNSILHQSTFA